MEGGNGLPYTPRPANAMSPNTRARNYPEVPPQPRLPEIEERVLAHWERVGIFRASVEGRPAGAQGENEFVFYDGPPFANGLPHYGHLLTGFVKDVVPRFQTMRGHRVERRFGWDCHGLPAEMEAEKELGLAGRAKILEYGIERFNAHCRSQVNRYASEWQRFVKRQARWVDFTNEYRTMDLSYMESVMWAFQTLHKKGLVYESFRVLPYSWAAETPVSNFETRLDDSYRDRQDPALTVRLELEPASGDPGPLELWIWTTTPWTLPSNLALAVGPAIEYAVFELGQRRIVLGVAVAEKYAKELSGARRVATLTGRELVGRRYRPLFPYFRAVKNAFRVLPGDFVDTAEGTGIVHMAPGFGEDDQKLCAQHGIEVVCPVDEKGRFTSEVTDWAGLNVFEANKPIIAELKERGALVRHDTIVHSYPHCWRTDEPLIYRALSSWFVQVSAFRERMVELNRSIRWVPEHVRDGQFGKWLEGARDWSISRNRFWGSPIPVWKSDDPRYPRLDVYGSLAELERDFGVKLDDLHRPAIDRLVRPNPDDPSRKSRMRRVEDVLDCWFESGSMPYAQVHYPFENRAWFERHFPADFITEYIAQTRGWFYTLVVLSTALFDKPPFKNCICHGLVLDETGRKLSKRLRNYPEPFEVYDTHGADALRWYLCSSPILRGADLQIDRQGKAIGEVVRLVIHPIWNAYSFFCLYANADGIRARLRTDPTGVLDRYILAKLRATLERVTTAMEAYDLAGACAEIRSFLDALNNWYIRRSRPRFWKSESDQDKRDAYDTLYTVLTTLCRMAAPFLPLMSEEIHSGLTGEKSVHLTDWPDAALLPTDRELVRDMDRVRDVCSTVLALREDKRIRIRQPLARLVVAGRESGRLGTAAFKGLIKEEANVKDVRYKATDSDLVKHEVVLNFRRLGPRLGPAMKQVAAAVARGSYDYVLANGGASNVTRLRVGEYELSETDGDFAHRLVPMGDQSRFAVAIVSGGSMVVQLDTAITPELEREGLARDLVRLIQQARKDAKLHVSDRIRLRVEGDEALAEAVRAYADYLREQTLAVELELGPPEKDMFVSEGEVGDARARVALVRAKPQ